MILVSFTVAAIVLASFVVWERRSDHPMLNLEFFKNPRFTAANISITLVFFALFGSLFFLTQYLQFVLGYSALQAGYRVAPIALVLIVVSPITGRLVNRVGQQGARHARDGRGRRRACGSCRPRRSRPATGTCWSRS